MRRSWRALTIGITTVAIAALAVSGFFLASRSSAKASGAPSSSVAALQFVGDTAIGPGGLGNFTVSNQDKTLLPKERSPQVAVAGSHPTNGLPPPPTTNPNPTPNGITSNNPGFSGFNGLTHADQRLAGTGAYTNTQFSLEPPDQGLCAGQGYVVESVNNAIAVYDQKGNLKAGPTANSQFLNLVPEINRTTGVAGPFISDPKCLFDQTTQRWFFSELMEDSGNNVGATGRNYSLVAVSQTANPTGQWAVFKFDTTDDGLNGTPSHAGCPCFGDQPLIGADRYAFYVTTNEFGQGFNGAQVYAMGIWQLAFAASHNGTIPPVYHIDASSFLAPYGGLSYSIQPAVTPPGDWNSDNEGEVQSHHGLEYFMSALQFGNPPYQVLDNRIAVWAMTNTASLATSTPNPQLQVTVIGSQTYGQPNGVSQKPGPTPFLDYLTSLGYSNTLEQIDTNDDRMNQVVFADGSLWSAVNTIIGDGSNTGIAFFKVKPSWHKGTLAARTQVGSYVSVAGNSAFFPSVAVNSDGQGIMTFTVAGPSMYPSSAYIAVNGDGPTGNVHIAAAGVGPDDGFTGYAPFVGSGTPARWGDYSAAVAVEGGSIWAASEYIPNAPRTLYANWGTFVMQVNPDN